MAVPRVPTSRPSVSSVIVTFELRLLDPTRSGSAGGRKSRHPGTTATRRFDPHRDHRMHPCWPGRPRG